MSKDGVHRYYCSTGNNIKGNVYRGTVENYVSGLTAYFVNYDHNCKNGFLSTTASYKKGESVIVQVTKDARGTKGVSLSTNIKLKGMYCNFFPTSNMISRISKKATYVSSEANKKLTSILQQHSHGIVLRKSSLIGNAKVILNDIKHIKMIWQKIQSNNHFGLVYQQPPFYLQNIINHIHEIECIYIEGEGSDVITKYLHVIGMNIPVNTYNELLPLYDYFNIRNTINALYSKRVDLPKGGSIVFDTGEAMTCIDVNSGGSNNRDEETNAIYTNIQAASVIFSQIQLRNYSGLIAIDFIDMQYEKNRQTIEEIMKQKCRNDLVRCNCTGINEFGVMMLSRERNSQTIYEIIYDDVPNHHDEENEMHYDKVCLYKRSNWQVHQFFQLVRLHLYHYKMTNTGTSKTTLFVMINIRFANLLYNNYFYELYQLEIQYRCKINTIIKNTLHEYTFNPLPFLKIPVYQWIEPVIFTPQPNEEPLSISCEYTEISSQIVLPIEPNVQYPPLSFLLFENSWIVIH